jgi:hypothetical protein
MYYELDGERLILKEWAARIGAKPHTLGRRLREGWPLRQALTMPTMTKAESGKRAADLRWKDKKMFGETKIKPRFIYLD